MEISAVVMAAGKSTRMKSKHSKVVFQVSGKPIIQWVADALQEAGCQDQVYIVGEAQAEIRSVLGENVAYVLQEEQRGTGHAVMECAPAFEGFDGSVLITFGDMPLFRREEMLKMCLQHQQNGAACTLMTAENPSLTMWARVLRDADGNFAAIVEGKDCTPEQAQIRELFSGVMVFDSKALFSILPQMGCNNVQHEYYVTEVPELMRKQGLKVETYFTADGSDLHGINTPEDLAECEKILRQRCAIT